MKARLTLIVDDNEINQKLSGECFADAYMITETKGATLLLKINPPIQSARFTGCVCNGFSSICSTTP